MYSDGQFAIYVLARAEASGAGGSQIFLWTFVQDQIVYSSQSVRWPGTGKTAKFNPAFSISAATGGIGPMVGVAGEIFGARHRRPPPGAHVEALIGETLCAWPRPGVSTTSPDSASTSWVPTRFPDARSVPPSRSESTATMRKKRPY